VRRPMTGPHMAQPSSPRAAAAEAFVPPARAALAVQDFDRFAALAAGSAQLTDPHARYVVRRALVELPLEGTHAAPALARRLAASAAAAIAFLEDEPREPVLLNLAGVALYELGALDAAQELFTAAERLAPGETDAAANLDGIAARWGRAPGRRALPATVRTTLGDLARRAAACARAAQPATGLTLSLCMIVRDEEERLPQCLAAARPAVDEIVVVDTGSSDRTREIALEHGARVVDFAWTGSFAEARNVAFDAATGDWMMFLDADEVLVAQDAPRLRALTGRTWREAFYLVETNYVGALEDGAAVTHNALRVFRNRPGYRFAGRIHEQILHTLPTYLPERIEVSDVRVEHFGYLGVVRDGKAKSRRNIELLERQAAEGDTSAFHAFNLGSEHLALGEAEAAARQLELAWERLHETASPSAYGFGPSLTSRLVKALRAAGRTDRAGEVADAGLTIFPGFTDLVFEQASMARDAGDDARAGELFERCVAMGDAPSSYTATVGCGTHLALCGLAAVHRRAGRLDEAERLLLDCLRDHPRHLIAVEPLAAVMLERGATPHELEAAVEERAGRGAPSVEFTLGTAFYEAAEVQRAEACFASVLARQPHNDVARVALAEAQLSQRRWSAAAETAAGVPAGSVCSAAARRGEVFARLAGGDTAGALRVLGGPPAAALEPTDAAVLGAWAALASGRGGPALGREAAPVLATTLEALLRVEEVEAFGLLAGLLDDCGLAGRERRELLAGMYLRRGFLASAAEEWLLACEENGPDTDALTGLAAVALAGGAREDARVFAAEATALDAADPRPRAILAAIAQG
jgi:tetratricopeptide (TPR) repeat protein